MSQSGLTLSGVVMSTVYRFFDLDFNIYVITDNVLELPVDQNEAFSKVMLETLLPKMGLKPITFDEALQAPAESKNGTLENELDSIMHQQ